MITDHSKYKRKTISIDSGNQHIHKLHLYYQTNHHRRNAYHRHHLHHHLTRFLTP